MNSYLKRFLNIGLLGIGLGIIIGSILKVLININQNYQSKEGQILSSRKAPNELTKDTHSKFNLNKLINEDKIISAKWRELADLHPDLEVSGYFFLLNSDNFAQLSSNKILPSASTIKIAILLIALQMIDKGELLWNEPLILKKELIGSGAGWMGYEQIGKHFPTHEVANEMIRISDNTASNLLIKRIGGIDEVNKRLKDIGLKDTQINNFLPDLKGTNKTTVRELALIIALVDSGNILSPESRDLFREIMSTSVSNNLIPAGILKGLEKKQEKIDDQLLIQGYRVYNKTGDIGISYSDAGLIQMPNTQKAVAAFIVKGPFNDPRSPELIRDMAAVIIKAIKPKSMLNPANP